MRSTATFIVFLGLACLNPVAVCGQGKAAAESAVMTSFAVLVGFPLEDQPVSGAVILVPGTIIPLTAEGTDHGASAAKETLDKSLSFTRAVEKLWGTFRLDPSRQYQKAKYAEARIGAAVTLPQIENANVGITATLVSSTAAVATYRVQFKQGDKVLADSTVPVTRGGRAVVGGTDGPAAPYIFVIVESALPGASQGGAAGTGKSQEITAPVPVTKVAPVYPEEAKKKGVTGLVVVEVIVNAEGKVEEARSLESADELLAEAALAAVRQWIFQPARNSKGEAVKIQISITLNFKLK